jgi:hypothetical protein
VVQHEQHILSIANLLSAIGDDETISSAVLSGSGPRRHYFVQQAQEMLLFDVYRTLVVPLQLMNTEGLVESALAYLIRAQAEVRETVQQNDKYVICLFYSL